MNLFEEDISKLIASLRQIWWLCDKVKHDYQMYVREAKWKEYVQKPQVYKWMS